MTRATFSFLTMGPVAGSMGRSPPGSRETPRQRAGIQKGVSAPRCRDSVRHSRVMRPDNRPLERPGVSRGGGSDRCRAGPLSARSLARGTNVSLQEQVVALIAKLDGPRVDDAIC